MKRIALIAIALVFLTAFGFGGYMLYQQLNEYAQGEEVYTDLGNFVVVPTPKITPTPEPDEDESEEDPENEPDEWADIVWPEVDFASLRGVNSDIVAWLYCEDTVINYPVVQTDDNSYYLNHLFDGKYNTSGCLFLDCRIESDFSDSHSIIYGHHLKSGKMFASLDGYKKQDYYDEHPVLLLITPNAKYVIELFAGYVAKVSDNAWDLGFSSDGEFEMWLDAAMERSCFVSEVAPRSSDRIITLSTCSYEFNDARFVILGRIEQIDRGMF